MWKFVTRNRGAFAVMSTATLTSGWLFWYVPPLWPIPFVILGLIVSILWTSGDTSQ